MLSQVERGETSPTLQVAARIAAGLELRLSQLLRLDEGGAVTVVRARRAPPGRPAPRPPLRDPHAAAARPARRALAPHARAGGAHRRPRRPADARARQPRDRAGRARHGRAASATAQRTELARRRLRDLRRGPAPPLREPRPGGGRRCWRSCQRRPAKELRCQRRCSTRSGRPTRSRRGLIYIDLHLVHEVTSPQAFDGLRLAGRAGAPARPHAGHGRPQRADRRHAGRRADPRRASRVQVETLERNCEEFGVPVYSLGSEHQGIVHVIGPELGRHPAGHDDRLRRLAHRHPRRVRRAGVRHRHERGRARARHAVPGPAQAAVDAHQLRRASSAPA